MAQAGQWADLVSWQFLLSQPSLSLSLVSRHDLHPCLAPLSILGFGKNQTKSVTIFGGKEQTGFEKIAENVDMNEVCSFLFKLP